MVSVYAALTPTIPFLKTKGIERGGHDLHYILYSFTNIQILYKITEGGYMAMVNRNETKVGC